MQIKKLTPILAMVFSLLITSGSSYAAEEANITSTLARPTKYYELADVKSNIVGEWPVKQAFSPPRPVINIKNGFANINENNKSVWVLLRNVKSDRKLRIANNCGAMPTDKQSKSVVTRGVGEPCKE